MKEILKKSFVVILVVVVYFSVWREIRSLVTQYAVIPQIEYAITNCDEYLQYDIAKPTSLRIYQYSWEREEYDVYSYTTPAGFFLLAGLVFIFILNGKKIHYVLLAGFHLVFWILSTFTILPGLCTSSVFLHFSFIGTRYFSPFVTFLIITMILSPKMRKVFDVHSQIRNDDR